MSSQVFLAELQGDRVMSEVDWGKYSQWRRSKTPVRRLDANFPGSELLDPVERVKSVLVDKKEERLQATLEFIGEVAELSHVMMQQGICRKGSIGSEKFLDEAGDCLFCGTWALDAWSQGGRFPYESDEIRGSFVSDFEGKTLRMEEVFAHAAFISSSSGSVANLLKKERYQGKSGDLAAIYLIRVVVRNIIMLLGYSGFSAQEAIDYNIDKLTKRYPNGFVPGGGVR